MPTVLRGIVKWFHDKKGYGFLIPDESSKKDIGDKEIFIHYSNIVMPGHKTLTQGQEVYFEYGDGRNGPQAKNVRPVETGSAKA